MKHAYLIIAHDNWEQLQILIDLLDDSRNDIYIHIDKKCKFNYLPKSNFSKIYILKNRIDVRWGDISMVKAELELFETALFKDVIYDYYHLLSGVDFPIKSNDYICNFFEKHKGKEFVGYASVGEIKYINRVNKVHLLTKYYRVKWRALKILLKIIKVLLEFIVNSIVNKNIDDSYYKMGPQWVSITEDCVNYLVSKKELILDIFKNTCCADEFYKQTLIWNSSFKNSLYNIENEYTGCMRLIDWDRGTPYIWGANEDDWLRIKKSEHLFARKFDIKKYPNIISSLKNELIYSKH